LSAISPESACLKPDPDNWSKQEILGHLIDSALINHQRFVRGAYNAAENFPPYDQVRWVELQAYNERNWADIIELWVMVNKHLCAIMSRLTDEQIHNLCGIGRESPVMLEFVMEDYLRHLKMHLGQILENSD
jgi:hypothetical protein